MRSFLSVLVLFVGVNCTPPDPCPAIGNGSVALTFSGLPAGAEGKVTVDGPGNTKETFTAGETRSVKAGVWVVSAERATVADSIVRTVYAPQPATANLCVTKDATTKVEVAWTKIPTSGRLWFGNGSGGTGSTHGFDSASLRASGSIASSWFGDVPASKAMAFDRAGNVWAAGNTTSDPMIGMIAASKFSASGRLTADLGITVNQIRCLPAIDALAFDGAGNLFVGSSCAKKVFKLGAHQLKTTATIEPLYEIGVMSVKGLAFDKDGHLWVADGESNEVQRFAAGDLGGSTAPTAVRKVKTKRSDQPADTSTFAPDSLAFDTAGNLWSFDFGLNVVFAIPASELAGSGSASVTPLVRITVPVAAVLEGLAFDEAGGLWIPMAAGQFGRLAPAQLTVSTGAGAPTTPETLVTGNNLGSVQGPAFYPAARGTPLFSASP